MPKYLTALLAGVLLIFAGQAIHAQEDFYRGKTVRMVVGLAAGGGYDLYTRVIGRHLGKHIPGNPSVIVENMTGAGSIIAANYMYNAAKPDGLTIGHILGGLFLQQLLENPAVKFDGRKFEHIGVPAQDHFVVGVSKNAGIDSVQEWLAVKNPIKLGGVAPGGATDDVPKVLAAALGLPLKVVTGYKGTGPVRLAFDAGEVDGVCNSWESMKSTWRKQLDSGAIKILLQATPKAHPELRQIPVAVELAKSDEAKKLIAAITQIHGPSVRPYFLPPGTPKEQVALLRKAFMETMQDPEFLAEAKHAKLDVEPDDGASLEKNVKGIFHLEPALIAKLKEILK